MCTFCVLLPTFLTPIGAILEKHNFFVLLAAALLPLRVLLLRLLVSAAAY